MSSKRKTILMDRVFTLALALAEGLESEGVTYEDLVRIDEEVKAEVRAELEGADDERVG